VTTRTIPLLPESRNEGRAAAHASERRARMVAELAEGFRAQVRKFTGASSSPHILHRN